jgi:hypothetical protein
MPPAPPFGGDREMESMDRLSSVRADEGKPAPVLLNEAVSKLAMAAQQDPRLSPMIAEAMRMLNDALDETLTAPPGEMSDMAQMPPEIPTGGPPTLPI